MANQQRPGAATQQRVIRVFSTFRAMQAERGVLIKIFPKLRKLCEERAVTRTEVDLR